MGEDVEPTASERPASAARVGGLPALAAGSRVGKYEIVATLGQGGFGITYRARDTQLDRDVALKEFMPIALAWRDHNSTVLPRSEELADDFLHGRERFVEEARTLGRLTDTPGVVGVHDYLEANNTAYMAMALIHGETLDARLRRDHRLQQPALEQLLYRLLDGLEVVHKAGFLHRDIKPANILIDESGHATLVDFGSSRAAVLARTQTMTAVYTPGYTAPEQMKAGKQGPWTDIYALAATLYHCVTGRPPPGAIERLTGDPFIPVAEIAKGRYAPTLLAAIDAGLRLKANERPQSIAEWRQVLDGTAVARPPEVDAITRALDEPVVLPMEASSARHQAVVTTGSKRLPLGWVAAVIVVLALAGGGAWMVLQPAPETPEQTVVRLEEEGRRLIAQATKLRQEEEARQHTAAQARREADEEVARRAAEEKAATEAAARQQTAEAERQRAAAVEAHRKAEEEAARRAVEEKSASEAVARRKAEEEAAERAAADAARRRAEEQARAETEAKRKAEEAAARKAAEEQTARDKAEAEAKRKAEADARAATEAKAKADIDAKRQAEAVEAALRLSEPDRKRVQVALTSLGHDTQGSDGVFGPRSRLMIAVWQKSQAAPETGYLTGAQLAALRQQAAPALARYDDEQKKLEDDKRKAEEEAKKRADEERRPQPSSVTPPSVAAAPSTTAPTPGVDGQWSGELHCGGSLLMRLSVQVAGGAGRATITTFEDGPGDVSLRITGDSVVAELSWSTRTATLHGSVSGQRLTARGNVRPSMRGGQNICNLTLNRQPAPSTTTPTAAGDGLWSGTLYCERTTIGWQHGTAPQEKLSFQVAGGAGRASFMTDVGPGDVSLRITDDRVVADVSWGTRVVGASSATLRGSMSGRRLTASGSMQPTASARRLCTLTLDLQ